MPGPTEALLARLATLERRCAELERGTRLTPARPGYQPGNRFINLNQNAHGFSVGNLVLQPTNGGAWQKAKAGDTGWDTGSIAWVLAVPDANHALLALDGQVPGTFTAATTYWMSASSAGTVTATKPTNARLVLRALTASQAVLEQMGSAIATIDMVITNDPSAPTYAADQNALHLIY